MAETSNTLDLIWGCAAIAATLGVTQRACFHMLEAGVIPARKVGGRWVASRRKLEEHFEETAA
jgi:hypothetical protein